LARNTGDPVRDVYDLYRNARLNVKYYSCRVSTLQGQNFGIELVLAATASASAIAGLAFWTSSSGKVIWQVLTMVSALLALAKPLLKLTDRIRALEELVGEYRATEYEAKSHLCVQKLRTDSMTPAWLAIVNLGLQLSEGVTRRSTFEHRTSISQFSHNVLRASLLSRGFELDHPSPLKPGSNPERSAS
jgi:hypothetical protein